MNGDVNKCVGRSVMCYFCNSTFASTSHVQHHVKQCGSILEKCSNDCGAWIERKYMTHHTRQCIKIDTLQRYTMADTLPFRSTLGSQTFERIETKESNNKLLLDNMELIKNELSSIKMSLQEEREKNNGLRIEIEHIKNQYTLLEERNYVFAMTITDLRRSNEEECSKQQSILSEIREEINLLKGTYLECKESFAKNELQLLGLKQTLEYEQNERSQLELVLNNQDAKLRNITRLESDLDDMKNSKNQDYLIKNEKILDIQRELHDLKNLFMQENITLKQQLKDIQSNQNESNLSVKNTNDLVSKLEKLEFEIKSVKNTIEEDSTTLGLMDKNMAILSKTVSNLQESEKSIDNPLIISNPMTKIIDKTGNLLWKIDSYQEKLKDSIDNGIALHSPLFLSNKYGYTLQAEVNLNGIGKWKGRHITISVYIIPGEFDAVLNWPAALEVDIVLKDQTPKRSQSNDIIKKLSVKRKESQESSTKSTTDLRKTDLDQNSPTINKNRQYVFIPHMNLDKFDYIKNNIMYIEIIVSQ